MFDLFLDFLDSIGDTGAQIVSALIVMVILFVPIALINMIAASI